VATRADIEQELIARTGRWLTAAGLDGATVDGANESLNSAIGWAIRQSGGTVAALSLVTSTDVQTVSSADLDQLLDIAEYRTLITAYQNYTKVDVEGLAGKAKLDQLRGGLLQAITLKRAQLATDYGIGSYGAFSIALTRTDGYSALQAELDAS